MLFDAFICHATEDKSEFVRPLAQRLREQHVEVWYDEFTLNVGDSLRRSIDRGLAQSRFGIVVLSHMFFNKHWTQWELDGLVARQNTGDANVILPVWHGVVEQDVLAFSPSLAGTIAIDSSAGIEEVTRRLVAVIRPQGSTLVTARDHLLEWGFNPPVISDDWWLDVAAAAESNDMEGGFQESMGWGRWGFPLPPQSTTPAERGQRLAWAAMQMTWQKEADGRPVTQITPPDVVHDFIVSQTGLLETCHDYIQYLISYAPQMVIPGFAGPFENAIEELFQGSARRGEERRRNGDRFGSAITTDGRSPGCDDEYALRHPNYGYYSPAHLACGFVQGNYVANGPPIKFYHHADYAAWLLSDASLWLPSQIREVLTVGMAEWGVWLWDRHEGRTLEAAGFGEVEFTGKFEDAVEEAVDGSSFAPSSDAYSDLLRRFEFGARLLKLPNDGESLAGRLLSTEFIGRYFTHRNLKRRSRHVSALPPDL